MFGPELRRWILGLDQTVTVHLVRSLLLAEANRLHLPTGAVGITGEILAPDGGIDARTDFPPDSQTLYPRGAQTWQIKKVRDKPNLDAEFAKPKISADLKAGRGCVFVWNRESTDRVELDKWLRDGLDVAGLSSSATLILVEDLERLVRVHPAVIQGFGGHPMVALPLSSWATLDEKTEAIR